MDAKSLISTLSEKAHFFSCLDGTFSSVNVKIKECEDDGKLISISEENVFELEKKVLNIS